MITIDYTTIKQLKDNNILDEGKTVISILANNIIFPYLNWVDKYVFSIKNKKSSFKSPYIIRNEDFTISLEVLEKFNELDVVIEHNSDSIVYSGSSLNFEVSTYMDDINNILNFTNISRFNKALNSVKIYNNLFMPIFELSSVLLNTALENNIPINLRYANDILDLEGPVKIYDMIDEYLDKVQEGYYL